jgi:hypothetical protein
MLHTIDDQGNISWHCISMPQCSYHNCTAWDRGVDCSHHTTAGVSGQTHTAHISDPDIVWMSDHEIALPQCPECGEVLMITVHGDIAEPVIAKDETTGKILQVAMPVGFEHHGNLWFKDADIVKKYIPHPSWAHLSIEQIRQAQEHIHSLAPNSPVDWMIQELTVEDIHSVVKHPAVDRHNALAEQLKAAGKVYAPPTTVTTPTIEETVAKILQEHGVITSPRIPAANPPS